MNKGKRQSAMGNGEEPCECVQCCDGEHAGSCMECAGWGDRIDDEVPEDQHSRDCDYCGRTGVCPVCRGASSPSDGGGA